MLSKSIATAFLLANAFDILFFCTEAVSPTKQSTAFLSMGKEGGGNSKHLTIRMGNNNLFCGHIECYCESGGMTDQLVVPHNSRFTFHPRCGTNIAIINKGRTAQRLSESDPVNSVAFTNRPLKDNEIFEVRLDRKLARYGGSLGIGIITRNPSDFSIPSQIWTSPDVKIYYINRIYSRGVTIVNGYGRNLDTLTVGERVGVMRNEFGTLHFFVNGVDQGPVASNLPSTVYGLFDLYADAVQATIVDSTSPTYS